MRLSAVRSPARTKLRQDLLNREIIKIERVELDEKVIIIAFDNTDFFYEL